MNEKNEDPRDHDFRKEIEANRKRLADSINRYELELRKREEKEQKNAGKTQGKS